MPYIVNAVPPDPQILDLGSPTDRQRQLLEAWIETGSAQKAATKLGICKSSVITAKKMVTKRAAAAGWTPAQSHSNHVPHGYHVKGLSTLVDADGKIKQTWIKTQQDQENQRQALMDFVEGLNESIQQAEPREFKPITELDKNLLPAIFIGDAHIGMRADGSETRDRNFDSRIAQKEIITAIHHLVDCAPRAATGLLVNVGDFIHANNSNATTGSGTPLDVDTRYEKIMRVAADTLVSGISIMLDKFEQVTVCIARGNHDPDAAIAIQMILEYYYAKEPRVTVLKSTGYTHYIQFGKNLIGVHHGDKIKAEKLAAIMPREQPEKWSQTTHRMWAVGHFHHAHEIETDNGVIVRKFGTLAPPDSWHSSMGYSSAHVMEMIVFRREGGKMLQYCYEIPKQSKGVDVEIL